MAVGGKILREIERMFSLVGTLQEQTTAMSKQLTALDLETSSSAECKEDLNEKEPTAEFEIINKEEEKTKQEREQVMWENTNQKLIFGEYKQGDHRMESIPSLRKIQKMKVEALGVYGTQELEIKKYNWGLHIDFDFDHHQDSGLVEIHQQLLINMGRDYGLIGLNVNEIFRDSMTDKEDFQQNRRRGTEIDLRASDVRNPG